MKILNIIQRYPPAVGGSETWCQEVCRYLANKGHAVKVLTMNVNKEEEFWREPLDEDATMKMGRLAYDQSVEIRRYTRSLPIFSFYHLFLKRFLDWTLKFYFYGPHSVELYAKMGRYMRHADIVFLHTLPFPHNYLALGVAKFFKKKVAIVPHFHPSHPDYERASNYWLLNKCDLVVADTDFEKEYFEAKNIPPEKVKVAGVGIHPEEYIAKDLDIYRNSLMTRYNVGPSDRIVTFIGRKMENKGVGYLIDAVKSLEGVVGVKLFLVGPSFDWFTKLYATLTPSDRHRIIDMGVLTQQEKVNLLHCTDLFVLPSKFEAFGIVFLEAWICGVPVLGTTEGAMPNLIGDDGYLSKFGDVESLAGALRDALSDQKQLHAKGKSGQRKVLDRYVWDVVGKQTEAILLDVHGKRRILLCANAYPPNFIGGAELIAHYQAKALQKLGYEVGVFAGDPNTTLPHYSMKCDEFDGVRVYRVSLHPKDYSSEFLNFFHREPEEHFRVILDSFAPDVVHFHNVIGLSAGLIHEAKRRGLNTVLTVHDHWGFCFKNTLIKREGEICDDYSKCYECMPFVHDDHRANISIGMRKDFLSLQLQEIDYFISPSKYLADTYVAADLPGDKFSVIPYGIDVERYSKLAARDPDGRVHFTFIGYVGRHKGIQTLLESLLSLGELSTVRLNIVGTGDQLPICRQFVERHKLQSVVRFWGQIDNSAVVEILKETNVLVLPSIWPENQPVTITEAMAAGRPVIASRIGGIPEIVEDGKTGYLFEAGNSRDLAEKMVNFIRHPELLTKFGEHSRMAMVENTYSRRVERLGNLYDKIEKTPSAAHEKVHLVVCVGRSVDGVCSNAMELIGFSKLKKSLRFVMRDWLAEDQIQSASLFWVVDERTTLEEVIYLMHYGKALLVPQANEDLFDLCRIGDCGLTYEESIDAAESIRFLCESPEVAATIGMQNVDFLYAD